MEEWQEYNWTRIKRIYKWVLKYSGKSEVVVDEDEWMTVKVTCLDWSEPERPRTICHMEHLKKGN